MYCPNNVRLPVVSPNVIEGKKKNGVKVKIRCKRVSPITILFVGQQSINKPMPTSQIARINKPVFMDKYPKVSICMVLPAISSAGLT